MGWLGTYGARNRDGPDARLKSWTHVYNPSQVILSYDRSEDVLVKPPHRVQLSNRHGKNDSSYFLKVFIEHGSQYQLNRELATFKKIAKSSIKAGVHISCLHGVVATEDGRVLGLLLNWVDAPKGAYNTNTGDVRSKEDYAGLHRFGRL